MSMLNKQVDEETMEQEMSFYVDAKHQGNLSRGIETKPLEDRAFQFFKVII